MVDLRIVRLGDRLRVRPSAMIWNDESKGMRPLGREEVVTVMYIEPPCFASNGAVVSSGNIRSLESIHFTTKWYDYELDYLDNPSPDVTPCDNYDAAICEFLEGWPELGGE